LIAARVGDQLSRESGGLSVNFLDHIEVYKDLGQVCRNVDAVESDVCRAPTLSIV